MQDSPDTTLVYILSASHSGSTLTAMMLNAHPDICTAGELKATNLGSVSEYRCSCRELIVDCDFWTGVAAEMGRRGWRYDVTDAKTSFAHIGGGYVQRLLRPLHRGSLLEAVRDSALSMSSDWRREIERWRGRNKALVESIGKLTGARYVVDSSKIGIRLKYLLSINELRVKVIRLVRDGRGVALTYMNPSAFADASDPALRGGGTGRNTDDSLGMLEAATEWLRSNQEAEQVLKYVAPADWIQVSYESLCLDTASTMARIHDFLGVPRDDSYRQFRAASHHVVGNGMRLDEDSVVALDERWRDELSRQDLNDFDRVAGALNRHLGYTG